MTSSLLQSRILMRQWLSSHWYTILHVKIYAHTLVELRTRREKVERSADTQTSTNIHTHTLHTHTHSYIDTHTHFSENSSVRVRWLNKQSNQQRKLTRQTNNHTGVWDGWPANTYTRMHANTHTHTQLHAQAHTHTHTHTHTRSCVHRHTHIHMRIHAHTNLTTYFQSSRNFKGT